MSEWAEFTLGELGEKIALGPFGSNIKVETFKSAGIPIISGSHLHQTRLQEESFNYISVEHADRLLNSNVYRGDVIFTHAGNVGQVSFIPENSKFERYIISQRQFYLRCNKSKLDHEYITYYFKSPIGQHQLLSNVNQTGVPSLAQPGSYLKQLVVKIPSLYEQKAISAVLSSLDDKIDLLHRQNKTLEAMAETLFRQWFVEEAQEDWAEVTVGHYVELNRASIDKNYSHNVIEYLDTGSLTEGKIEGFQTIALTDAPSRAKRLVQHNDVLISTVRPDQKHYGIIKNPIDNLVVSTGFCVITCTKIDPHFIYLLLTGEEMTDYLHTIADASTTTYPSLKPSDIGAITFQLPPDDRLKEFGEIAQDAWEKIEKNHIQIRTLEELRDTLLPKLISGQIRVS